MASPVEQDYWLKALAKRTGIRDEALRSEAEKFGKPKAEGASASQQSNDETAARALVRPATRHALLAERLVGHAWAAADFSALDDAAGKFPPQYARAAEVLRAGKTASENPALDEILNLVMLRAEPLDPKELSAMKDELTNEYTKERRRVLTLEVRRAEEDGDHAALEAALKAMGELPFS